MDSSFVQRSYAFTDFDGISVDGSFRIRVLKSEEWGILVFSSREDLEKIKLRNRNGVFEISDNRIEPVPVGLSPVLVISMPRLLMIRIRGAVQMEAGGFSTNKELDVSMGSGTFLNLDGFEVSQARFSLEDSCTLHAFLSADSIGMTSRGKPVVRLGGRARQFDYTSDGPSRLDGTLLLVDHISLNLSGVSEIRITPDISMKIKSRDRAVIYYTDKYMDVTPDVEGNAILRKF